MAVGLFTILFWIGFTRFDVMTERRIVRDWRPDQFKRVFGRSQKTTQMTPQQHAKNIAFIVIAGGVIGYGIYWAITSFLPALIAALD